MDKAPLFLDPKDDGTDATRDKVAEEISSEKSTIEFYATIPDLKGAIMLHGSGNKGRIMIEIDMEHYSEQVFELVKMAKMKALLVRITPGDEKEVSGYYI